MVDKKKLKTHSITPIGLEAAKRFVDTLINYRGRGKQLGERTARAFTLVLAYNADVMEANHAANKERQKDCTAIHQLKWRSIPVVKMMIKTGAAHKAELKRADVDQSLLKMVKCSTNASDQDIAALKIVLKTGAPVHEIEAFCDVKIAHLVEVAKELQGKI